MSLWILVIVGIVLLVVWLARESGISEQSRVEESALEILKKRYGRGEISKKSIKKRNGTFYR